MSSTVPNVETVSVACDQCKKLFIFVLDSDKVKRWKAGVYMSGEFIQHMFPELSDDEREVLISGTCGKCYDEMFQDEE